MRKNQSVGYSYTGMLQNIRLADDRTQERVPHISPYKGSHGLGRKAVTSELGQASNQKQEQISTVIKNYISGKVNSNALRVTLQNANIKVDETIEK